MLSKSKLGQFYTTNWEYIFTGMYIPPGVSHIIEPFCGKGNILQFLNGTNDYTLELYDIDPQYEGTLMRDTLEQPPNYDNKFILTNPPYLARNKNPDKALYDIYKTNDLYKCFILTLINSSCEGGIIIVPLNFICSVRKADVLLRKKFLMAFDIVLLNIFEESVFDDTSYAVCSIQFQPKGDPVVNMKTTIFPSRDTIHIQLTKENNYTFGGDIHMLPIDKTIKIERATRATKENTDITNILLKCIDDNITHQLGLQLVDDEKRFIDNTANLSARSYATLVINKPLTRKEQENLVERFNSFILAQRAAHHSLFLTNYRESNSIARKRISFSLAFRICNYLLQFPQ
tara:strand:- start:6989 stop:8023 length:1035 start_codon:yes stop_codon:yes gene_type:complete